MDGSPNSERRVRFDFDDTMESLGQVRMAPLSTPSHPHPHQLPPEAEPQGTYFSPILQGEIDTEILKSPWERSVSAFSNTSPPVGFREDDRRRPRSSSLTTVGLEARQPDFYNDAAASARRPSGPIYASPRINPTYPQSNTPNSYIPQPSDTFGSPRQPTCFPARPLQPHDSQQHVTIDPTLRRPSLVDPAEPRQSSLANSTPRRFSTAAENRRSSLTNKIHVEPEFVPRTRSPSSIPNFQASDSFNSRNGMTSRSSALRDRSIHIQPLGSFIDPRSPDPGAVVSGSGVFTRSPVPDSDPVSPRTTEPISASYRRQSYNAGYSPDIPSQIHENEHSPQVFISPPPVSRPTDSPKSFRYRRKVDIGFVGNPYTSPSPAPTIVASGGSNFSPSKSSSTRFPFDPIPPQRHYDPNPSRPPLYTNPSPLRSVLRHSQSEMDLTSHTRRMASSLSRGRGSSRLEEGGVPAQKGVFGNLMKLYGMTSRRRGQVSSQGGHTSGMGGSRSRASSLDSSRCPSVRGIIRSRNGSSLYPGESGIGINPEGGRDFLLDPDDPRVTGAPPNHIDQEKHANDTFVTQVKMTKKKKKRASIKYHIASIIERQQFILKLAHALMLFGAPSHRLEAQLTATAKILEIEGQFIHLPSIIIASFGDNDAKTSQTFFVKVNGALELGRLHTVHNLYRRVVHDEVGVEEATKELEKFIKAKPIYGLFLRCVLAALCAGLICPLAFGGSVLDMLIAAVEGAILAYLQLGVASKNAMYSNVFEISIAILMSFIARALSSIPSQIFCYSAISSAGVVLVLPGYMILCSALELASKNIVSGSVKLTFAIVYSLFLGFGLTIGSDLYYLLDPNARRAALIASEPLNKIVIHGTFRTDNSTGTPAFAGAFTFTNSSASGDPDNWIENCYRNPDWPWYLQPFPVWSLFLLVPLFSIFSSSWSMQPFRSKQLPVMVLISCCSFAANKAANHYIFNRSDVVSAIGAFVIGILGNLYSRVTKTGTSFTSMVTGVLFLVPAGIAATGGLSMNYRGQDGDEYSNGLVIGLRMIQVAIGITVGLFGSSLVVYSFGRSKKSAVFAF